MKKKGCLVLLILACLSIPPLCVKAQGLSSEPSRWAESIVLSAITASLVPDELQSNYQDNITRVEFCQMAMRYVEMKSGMGLDELILAKEVTIDTDIFIDTQDKAILIAEAMGIVNGEGNRKFNPHGEITREQAATMLTNIAVALGVDVHASTSSFSDNPNIASWATASVDFVSSKKIMNGTGNNSFDPKSPYTREQAIVSIYNMYTMVLASSDYAESKSDEIEKLILTQEQNREINIFLSNFWEAHFINYDKNRLNAYELIDFAIWHNYKNNYRYFLIDAEGLKINKLYIESTLEKYLDIHIRHQSVKSPDGNKYRDYTFDGDYYSFMPADGNMSLYFVTVKEMYFDPKTQTYICSIDLNTYFSPEEYNALWEGEHDLYHPDFPVNHMEDITTEYSGTAIVKKVTEAGETRYVLLSMKTE